MQVHASFADNDTETVNDSDIDCEAEFEFNQGVISDDGKNFNRDVFINQIRQACNQFQHNTLELQETMIRIVAVYCNAYKRYMKKCHPYLSQTNMNRVIKVFYDMGLEDFKLEDILFIINKHFQTEYYNCDYNICHFASGRIIENKIHRLEEKWLEEENTLPFDFI